MSMCTTFVVMAFALQHARGTTIITAFPKHNNARASPVLFISLNGSTQATVTVAMPGYANGIQEMRNLNVTEPTTTIWLSGHSVVERTEVAPKGIVIESDNDIVVLAASFLSAGILSSLGAASLLPLNQLSTRYTVVAVCETNNCFIVVVNGGDRDVRVNVTLPEPIDQVTFMDTRCSGGDVITCTLTAFSVAQIRGWKCDFTGSVVEASSPVAVLSGGAYTELSNPRDASETLNSDHVIDQMPPETSLGKHYVLIPFPDPDHATLVKVVFTINRASLTYNTSLLISYNETSEYDMFLLNGSSAVLEASQPVLVALMSQSSVVGSPESFDASAVVVSSTTSWGSAYLVLLPIFANQTFYASVATNSTCGCAFYLNKRELLDLEWLQTEDQTYNSTTFTLGSEDRYVLENPGCVFGGYAFSKGQDKMASFGFFQHVPTMTDNPCDTETTVSMATTASDHGLAGSTLTDMTEELDQSTQVVPRTSGLPQTESTSVKPLTVTPELLQTNSAVPLTSELPQTTQAAPPTSELSQTTPAEPLTSELSQTSPAVPPTSELHQTTQAAPPTSELSQTTQVVSRTSEIPQNRSTSFAPGTSQRPQSTSSPVVPSTSELPQIRSTPVAPWTQNHRPFQCACTCSFQRLMTQISKTLSDQEQDEAKKNITKELVIMKSNLSATQRKVTSAKNLKKSSTYSGSVILGAFCGFLLFIMIIPTARPSPKQDHKSGN